MSGVAGYLMRLICSSIVCAIIGAMDGNSQGIRRLIAGIFMTLTVLSPMGDLDLPSLDLDGIHAQAQSAVRDGTAQAKEMRESIISEAYTAYIWSKAAEMGLELEIQLELDEEELLRTVVLTGLASPLERQRLTDAIIQDLGVGKEAVTWIDPYQSSA